MDFEQREREMDREFRMTNADRVVLMGLDLIIPFAVLVFFIGIACLLFGFPKVITPN